MRQALVMVASLFCLSVMVAATGHAGTVYMSDGETTIDCQSVWRQGGKVYVMVNRDIQLEFSQAEVDLARTFRKQPSSSLKKSHSARPEVAPAVKSAAVITPPKPAAPVETKAVPAPVPAAKPAAPAPAATPKLAAAPTAKEMPAASAVVTPKPAPQPPVVAVTAVPTAKTTPPLTPLHTLLSPDRPVTGSDPQSIALPEAVAGMWKIALLVFLAVLLLMIISFWRVFEKAGEPGWACLVPIYNLVVLLNMAGKPIWWLLLLFIPLVGLIISLLIHIAVAERFGKGALFGLGLFLFGFIFWPVLAFDDSAYQG